MNSFKIKPYLPRLYVTVFLVFIANKFLARPFVLDHDFPGLIRTIVMSIPNTCEAIIGMCMSTGVFLLAKHYFKPRFDRVPNLVIYLASSVVTAVYVLTQEFQYHNLGGNNVYDPYDVAGSLVGLVIMLWVFSRFGFNEE